MLANSVIILGTSTTFDKVEMLAGSTVKFMYPGSELDVDDLTIRTGNTKLLGTLPALAPGHPQVHVASSGSVLLESNIIK